MESLLNVGRLKRIYNEQRGLIEPITISSLSAIEERELSKTLNKVCVALRRDAAISSATVDVSVIPQPVAA